MLRITCPCGKTGTAPERVAGHRVKCPACGRSLAVSAFVRAPEPHPAPAPAAVRRSGNRAILISASALMVLAGLSAVLHFSTTGKPAAPAAPSQRPPPAQAVPVRSAADEPITLSDADMPGMAELCVRLHFAEIFEAMPGVKNLRILELQIKPAPRDPRQIPYLWLATASIATTHTLQEPAPHEVEFPTTWRMLYWFTPKIKGLECWREVTDVRFGNSQRVHGKCCEWTPEFRGLAVHTWTTRFQDQIQAHPASDERQALTKAIKLQVADELRIRAEELQEILEAKG